MSSARSSTKINPQLGSLLLHNKLESPQSLFQQPLYRGTDGQWLSDLRNVALREPQLDWDLVTAMSMLSFGHTIGNRTLFSQIRRRPWLSSFDEESFLVEHPIPAHGRRWLEPDAFARELLERLENELEAACKSFGNIYLLLSGGLDSRIVAGIVRRLIDAGRMNSQVLAVTWGIRESRDVILAEQTAKYLNLNWKHLELGKPHLAENIETCHRELSATVSPIHLHRMGWFLEQDLSDTIVLAGSYGDSVGRSEYSGRTVLELQEMKPANYMGLLHKSLVPDATNLLRAELGALKERAGTCPPYVYREHQQQCHYMRGVIAQCMNVISHACPVYQAFTHPDVYQLVWSIHPSARTNQVYTELLGQIGFKLQSIPWARTGVSPDGKSKSTAGQKSYHDYVAWTQDFIKQSLQSRSFKDYLAEFEVLEFVSASQLRRLVEGILENDPQFRAHGHRPHGILLWLTSLKYFAADLNIDSLQTTQQDSTEANSSTPPPSTRLSLRKRLAANPQLRLPLGRIRRLALRRLALLRYPVED